MDELPNFVSALDWQTARAAFALIPNPEMEAVIEQAKADRRPPKWRRIASAPGLTSER